MTILGDAQNGRTPKGLKVAPTSYAELEEVAKELQYLLPKVKGYGGGRWMVDAWRVLEQTLHKAGFRHHIASKDELVECAAFTVPEEKLIVLRSDVYEGLFENNPFSRSTVIHELSHIVLNHAVTLHRGAVLGQHKFFEDSEWQAKALTAAIMMPIEACLAASSSFELSEITGTSLQAAIYRLDKLVERGILPPKSDVLI